MRGGGRREEEKGAHQRKTQKGGTLVRERSYVHFARVVQFRVKKGDVCIIVKHLRMCVSFSTWPHVVPGGRQSSHNSSAEVASDC